MQKIRHATFETNSSSCHTLSIASGSCDYESITPDHNHIVQADACEFGWGVETINNANTKLAYCLQYINDWVHDGPRLGDWQDKDENKREKSLRDTLLCSDTQAGNFFRILTQVVNAQTGGDGVDLRPQSNDEYYSHGYIDHQSVEGGELHYLFVGTAESNQELRSFIFSPQSVLMLDNDNH
jgi:hypothetical protein